jgi:hypothetical protein
MSSKNVCVWEREKTSKREEPGLGVDRERRVTRVSCMTDPAGGFLVGMLQVGNDDSSLEL